MGVKLVIYQFFKNTAFLFVIELIVRLKALILIPLLTNHLGPSEFGVWSQVSVLVAVLSPLVTLGTDQSLIRFLPGVRIDEARSRYSGWIVFIITTTLIFGGLQYAFRKQISLAFFGDDPRYVPFVGLAALSLLGMIANSALRLWFRISNRGRAFGTVAALQSFISLVSLLAAVLNGADPFQIISWPIYGDLFLALLLTLRLRKEQVWAMPSWEGFCQMLSFGLVVLPAGFAVWGLNYIDRIFLVRYTSIAEVGVYALAFSIASIAIQFAAGPIWTMYYTSAAELHNTERKIELQRLFDRSIEAICLVTAPLVALMIFYGKDIISLLSTSTYLPGAPIMPVIALGYVLTMFSSYFETSLALHDRARVGTIAALAAVAIKVVLNILLIVPWGIYGAAASSIAAFSVQLGITYSACVSSGYVKLFPRYGVIAYIYAILGFSLPWVVIEYWVPEHGLIFTVLSAGFGAILYLVAILRAGGLHPEVVNWIHSSKWEGKLNANILIIFNWIIGKQK